MNKTKRFTLMLFLFTTLIVQTTPHVYSAGATTVHVNPTDTSSSIGQTFTTNITVTNVTNLNAWQLYLLFNPEMLNCTGIRVPPENVFAPYDLLWFPPQINNTGGYILAFCALNGTFGVNGSGTLCQVEFKCIKPGITSLNIANEMQAPIGTYLQDPKYNFILFDATDGMVDISGPGFQKSVFNVTQNSETYQVIVLSNSTVTSFNYSQTLKTMTFDVSGSDGTKGLSYVAVPKQLLNGTIAVLVNNKAVYYILSESEEHNFLSITYTHSTKNITILLTIRGDVNGDRKIDMKDIVITILAYGSYPNHPNWNPLADITGPNGVPDGKVGMYDIVYLILRFGNTWNP